MDGEGIMNVTSEMTALNTKINQSSAILAFFCMLCFLFTCIGLYTLMKHARGLDGRIRVLEGRKKGRKDSREESSSDEGGFKDVKTPGNHTRVDLD